VPSAPIPTQKSEPHVRAARARWGPERSVRLDALDPRIRSAIVALIAADDAAKKAPDAITSSASEEVERHARATATS